MKELFLALFDMLLFVGSTIPQYSDMLLSSVLAGVRDEEAFVRASSLSNLGEICKLLKFSLGNILHEVRTSNKCLTSTDLC